jgi:hypothetical protein
VKAPTLVELDFDGEDFGPELRRCICTGIPVSFRIHGSAMARLRNFVSHETVVDWPRLAGVPRLNLLCVAIALASSHSMQHRVLEDAESYRVEFFRQSPEAN